MKGAILRELSIYVGLLLVLGFGMHHKELLSHPIEHFENMQHAPLGVFHPFVFTFFVYLGILIIRIFIKLIKRFTGGDL